MTSWFGTVIERNNSFHYVVFYQVVSELTEIYPISNEDKYQISSFANSRTKNENS